MIFFLWNQNILSSSVEISVVRKMGSNTFREGEVGGWRLKHPLGEGQKAKAELLLCGGGRGVGEEAGHEVGLCVQWSHARGSRSAYTGALGSTCGCGGAQPDGSAPGQAVSDFQEG